MENLKEIINNTVDELENYDQIREKVISLTRQLNRISGRSIANLVMNKSIEDNLIKAKDIYSSLKTVMDKIAPITSWKIAGSGVEEYSEFVILYNIITYNKILSPQEMDIPIWIWLSSLGDVTGELRRLILNRLLSGLTNEAKTLLNVMQILYNEISGLNFSKSLIPNFRRKVDTARVTIERTESDVLNYLISVGRKEGLKNDY